MKLYYMPMACSLAAHIVANEAEIPLELVRVDGSSKQTETGEDFLAVNSHGYVPTLVLDDGQALTEAQVVLQFLADRNPASGLMPAAGEMARYRAKQWLAFISSELHKNFSPFFKPATPEAVKTAARELLAHRLKHVDTELAGKTYLMGEKFTAPDAYLFTILNWTRFTGIDLSSFRNLQRFMENVSSRPAVAESLRAQAPALEDATA